MCALIPIGRIKHPGLERLILASVPLAVPGRKFHIILRCALCYETDIILSTHRSLLSVHKGFRNDDQPWTLPIDTRAATFQGFDYALQFPGSLLGWETRCLDEAGLDQAMGVFSHGEQIMATFFRNIWSGSDQPPLGLVDAVGTLGGDDLAVIIGWLRDPFFP
jgi:hypothetical protein